MAACADQCGHIMIEICSYLAFVGALVAMPNAIAFFVWLTSLGFGSLDGRLERLDGGLDGRADRPFLDHFRRFLRR